MTKRAEAIVVAIGMIFASLSGLASAQTPSGAEFQINTYTTGEQQNWHNSVAVDASGNSIVVWSSDGQDGSLEGAFGQRYDSNGNPLGSEFQINTYTPNRQAIPAVAADASGNFLVVWSSMGQDGDDWGIFAQRYDSSGTPQGGEFQVNTYTTSFQYNAVVAADGGGNFIVVWSSGGQDGSSVGTFGQRLDGAGNPLGGEFQVNTFTTSTQDVPAVAADASGNFVVVWASDGEDGSYLGVFGQRFDSAGNPDGTEFQVNSQTIGSQWRPSVAMAPAGDFVVAWQSTGNQDGSFDGVFGQHFDSAGNPDGSEFQINTYTPGNQDYPVVATSATGAFLVAWQDSNGQDGDTHGVFARHFDSAATPDGPEFQVNTYTVGLQGYPAVAGGPGGSFLVVWSSDGQDGSLDGVFGQRYVAGPVPTTTSTTATSTTSVSTTSMVTTTSTSVTTTSLPGTTDHLIPVTVNIIKPGLLFKFVSRGTFTLPAIADDPTVAGASLTFSGTTGGQTYSLPFGGWHPLATGFSFSGTTCLTVKVKTTLVKGICRLDTGNFGPLPEPGPVDIVLTVGTGTRYCAQCGGTPRGDPATIFKRKTCAAPVACS